MLLHDKKEKSGKNAAISVHIGGNLKAVQGKEEVMFAVEINEARFEYDIHSIVKAFYPEENVKVLTPETGGKKREEYDGKVRLKVELLKEEARLIFSDGSSFLWKYEGAKEAGKEAATEDDMRKLYERAYKDGFKRFLYTALSEVTKKTLPWGNLTGIRPTKIAMGLLEEGKSEEEIVDFMKTAHFVSDEKALLSVDIAKREKKLLSHIHYENGYSLYIGIPFCPTTCLYCSFTSNPICRYKDRVEEYIDCLIKEIEFTGKACKGRILDSVYIGGGTPTTLTAGQLDRLITALKERMDFSTVQEFTVEAGRADSITEEKLMVLKKQGVDRISINPQTMKEETLKLIGRQHTVEQVREAYAMARRVGGFNINMDIILGLPGEDEADVQRTVEEITAMRPDSFTVHSLAIKRASKLSQWIMENGVKTLRNTDGTMKLAAGAAKAMDMHPYYLYRQKNMSGNFENVGYATEGNYGIYNILIMEEKQTIVALGAGSITKVVYPDGRIERTDNVKDVALYMDKIDEMIERKRVLL